MKPIYLDYMATTPVDDAVMEAMLPYLTFSGTFGNATSKTHCYGIEAAEAIDSARADIAEVLGTSPEAIIFTSGATESNNLALLGATTFYARKGKHLVTMSTEHKAVLLTLKQLESEGFEVTYLDPKPDGLLDLNDLEQALRPDTILASIMHVNNEVGVIQDIAGIGELLRGRGILFHVDAAQSVGRVPIDLDSLNVDLMSLSAHKAYGPKGIGALYVRQRPRIRLNPQSMGGGQEGGLRAGTLPTHQIVGMAKAFTLAEQLRADEEQRLKGYQKQILKALASRPEIKLNGSFDKRIGGNLNLCFQGMKNEEVLIQLKSLAISTAAACASKKHIGSHVLRAMGLSDADIQSSVRMSLGRFTTDEDVAHITQALQGLKFQSSTSQ